MATSNTLRHLAQLEDAVEAGVVVEEGEAAVGPHALVRRHLQGAQHAWQEKAAGRYYTEMRLNQRGEAC